MVSTISGTGQGKIMVDLTPPQPPKKPVMRGQTYPEGYYPLSIVDYFGMVFFGSLMTGFIGSILGFVFMFLGSSPGPDPRQGKLFQLGFVVAGGFVILVILYMIYEHSSPLREVKRIEADNFDYQMTQYRKAYAEYEQKMAAWPAEKARRIAEAERQAAAFARQAELERLEANKREQQRLAEENAKRAEEERKKRLALWQEAQNWALRTVSSHYAAVAAKVAVQHGDMPEADLLKVFATAYPHFECSTDWRMGCLRELVGTDARVQAILPFLPAPDGQNTRP